MNCEKNRLLIQHYLEGALADSELRDLTAHVESCTPCRKLFEDLRAVEKAVQESFGPASSPAAARELILSRLQAAAAPEPSVRAFQGRIRAWIPLAVAAGLILGTALTLLAQAALRRASFGPGLPMHVAEVEGRVFLKHAGANTWEEVTRATALQPGDLFEAGPQASLAFVLKDQSKVTLSTESVFTIKHSNGRTEFELNHGTMRASLNPGHPPFSVRTPQAEVLARGTVFVVSVK